jgi:Uma2 family endonuclease
MSTSPASTLRDLFLEMEARLEREPETVQGEIVLGVYLMSPRPRPRHGGTQINLGGELRQRFGMPTGGVPPDWLVVIEPEIRSERTFSRLVPDVAGWRRSTSGWPDLDETPVTIVPEWLAEVLSSGTAATDRGPKLEAYGAMGVGWVWLLDTDARRLETFANVRGRMVPGPVFAEAQPFVGDPFGTVPVPLDRIFV